MPSWLAVTYIQILTEFKELKNCVACCNRQGLYAKLDEQKRELEICQKALNDYMESKRRAFPRFYFVSANDLLDILSNGNNPVRVQVHMNKCFQVSAPRRRGPTLHTPWRTSCTRPHHKRAGDVCRLRRPHMHGSYLGPQQRLMRVPPRLPWPAPGH